METDRYSVSVQVPLNESDYAYMQKMATLIAMKSGKVTSPDEAFQSLLVNYMRIPGTDLITELMQAIHNYEAGLAQKKAADE